MSPSVRTWVEIDTRALRHNAEQFLRMVPKETRLMAVIKSNAYGHGLSLVAKILSSIQFPASRLQFGVDSIVEALRLRKDGIKNPILVLGYTLPSRVAEAARHDIILTISNFDVLAALAAVEPRPAFHLKIDTGMHRQGFMLHEIPKLIATLARKKLIPAGIYTHFASAKDPNDTVYTLSQFGQFQEIVSNFQRSNFQNLLCHASATGGALLFPEAHLDMVRIGMGLYGYWPSEETKQANSKKRTANRMVLIPVLAWKSIIAEVKKIPKGSRVGYDGCERVSRDTIMAVIPIGYWHGYDRGLSKIGQMLVRGKRAKVLGRISMDMTVIDVTDIQKVLVGDEVVVIGTQGKEAVFADELAAKINTTAYEFLTRINPLVKRISVMPAKAGNQSLFLLDSRSSRE